MTIYSNSCLSMLFVKKNCYQLKMKKKVYSKNLHYEIYSKCVIKWKLFYIFIYFCNIFHIVYTSRNLNYIKKSTTSALQTKAYKLNEILF